MAILKIARLGHPVLRQIAEPLTRSQLRSNEVQRLIDDMVETMHEYEGVGLAAPQVHVSLRIALIEVPAAETLEREAVPLTVVVNPVVTVLGDEPVHGWEGCLSLPDLRGMVPRARRIRLEALDRQGRVHTREAADFLARVIQHECDHLDGVVYTDRMDNPRTLSFLREFERYVGPEAGPVED